MATGLGGASLFLPSLLPRRLRAQATKPIQRVVIMITQHGTVLPSWRMLRNNADYGDWEYAFDDPDPASFSDILRPLHARRANLLVLEGMAQTSTMGDRATNNHNAGYMHILTGAKMIDDTNAGGPSVDQIIAKQIALPGRIPSLELATGDPWIGGVVNLAARQRAPVQYNPDAVFQRVFPMNGAGLGQAPTERDLIGKGRQSVLDFVAKEYDAVVPRLGSEDRARLDMHRQLIRDLELRVGSLSSLHCSAPAMSAKGNQLDTARAFADITAAAFACDLTRVATLQILTLNNNEFGAPPGDVHQDFAHQEFSDPKAAQQMVNYNIKQAEVFAYLVDALGRYSEGNGTVLDNTAVIWVSELTNGPHELDKIPVVMAGSCGGSFRTGRYISYAQNIKNPFPDPGNGPSHTRPIGPGHSHFWISVMQAMGLPDNQIGSTSVVSQDGTNITIDLTGPLGRLT
jgi:hypothetical protein